MPGFGAGERGAMVVLYESTEHNVCKYTEMRKQQECNGVKHRSVL